MRLDQGAYEISSLKGDMINYFKEFIQDLQRNKKLVEQSFNNAFPGDDGLEHHMAFNLKTWFIGKDTSTKIPSSFT